jgi:NitT/TauT family transport system substrate-binding protein
MAGCTGRLNVVTSREQIEEEEARQVKRTITLIGVLALVAMACTPAATSAPSAAPPSVAASAAASEAPSAAPPTSAAAEKCSGQKVSFELSFIPNVQHAGFLVAKARGYYEDEGLDVTILPGGPTVDTTQDVADGTANLGQVDYVDIVEARAAGVPIKAVAQTYKKPFFFWYSKKDSGIADVAAWKGHTVGAIQPGDYPERDAMMLAAGLDPKTDINIVQQDFGTDDFIAGKVEIAEGVVFYHPAYLIGVNQMKFPDDFIVYDPAKNGADFASQTVAASEEFLAKDPAAVKCFLRASVRGWQATFADDQKAVDDVMTFIPEGAIPKPHQQGAIKSVLPIVGAAGDPTLLQPTPAKYTSTIDQLKKLGYLKTDVSVASTFDAGFYYGMGPVPKP